MSDTTYEREGLITHLFPEWSGITRNNENPQIVCMRTNYTNQRDIQFKPVDIRFYRVNDVPMDRIRDEFFQLFLSRLRKYPIGWDVSILKGEKNLGIFARLGGCRRLDARLCTVSLPDGFSLDKVPFDTMERKRTPHFQGIGEKNWASMDCTQFTDKETYFTSVEDFFGKIRTDKGGKNIIFKYNEEKYQSSWYNGKPFLAVHVPYVKENLIVNAICKNKLHYDYRGMDTKNCHVYIIFGEPEKIRKIIEDTIQRSEKLTAM